MLEDKTFNFFLDVVINQRKPEVNEDTILYLQCTTLLPKDAASLVNLLCLKLTVIRITVIKRTLKNIRMKLMLKYAQALQIRPGILNILLE